MKKYVSVLLLVIASLLTASDVYAQKDVTTFLGIPVDGSLPEMCQKLTEKGFVRDNSITKAVLFKGVFNGVDVHVYVSTNNNKVCRIMVCDANTQDEANIKIRFNNLAYQFENNKRYFSYEKYRIPDNEDISYEMTVHHKLYDAKYYQEPIIKDTAAFYEQVKQELLKKYTPDQINNPSKEITEQLTEDAKLALGNILLKKFVWFRINVFDGKYYIAMYYDNEYNMANGEDL